MTNLLILFNCKLFFFFFIFFLGFLLLITALFIILTESSVHSILYLMFIFVYLTELTILLKMEFLALIFIIIYIGAVCVLMLFHIKLIKTFIHRFDNLHNKELLIPFLIVSIFIPLIQIITLSLEKTEDELKKNIIIYKKIPLYLKEEGFYSTNKIHFNYTNWIDLYETVKSTEILGYLIYNIYFIYLIFGSLILLIAMIGSIYLTLIKSKTKQFQATEKQIFINISKTILINKIFKNKYNITLLEEYFGYRKSKLTQKFFFNKKDKYV